MSKKTNSLNTREDTQYIKRVPPTVLTSHLIGGVPVCTLFVYTPAQVITLSEEELILFDVDRLDRITAGMDRLEGRRDPLTQPLPFSVFYGLTPFLYDKRANSILVVDKDGCIVPTVSVALRTDMGCDDHETHLCGVKLPGGGFTGARTNTSTPQECLKQWAAAASSSKLVEDLVERTEKQVKHFFTWTAYLESLKPAKRGGASTASADSFGDNDWFK